MASVCENAVLTSQEKRMFFLEPNTNDHSLGTQIQLFSKAMCQSGSHLITLTQKQNKERHKSIVLKYIGQVVGMANWGIAAVVLGAC